MTNEILVIDDDAAVRGAFSLVLGEIGCTVRTAENGLEGIALAQTQRPDLIFLDLKMPGIDGIETMRRLLAHDATLTIYIVTAFSHEFLDKLRAVQSEGLKFQLANKPLTSSQIRHIARSALRTQSLQADEHRILLNLYVVSVNPEIQQFVEQLSEVLGMPEKALENDVFATPMLVREIPEPVLKLLGNLSKMHSVLAAITAQNGSGAGTIVL